MNIQILKGKLLMIFAIILGTISAIFFAASMIDVFKIGINDAPLWFNISMPLLILIVTYLAFDIFKK